MVNKTFLLHCCSSFWIQLNTSILGYYPQLLRNYYRVNDSIVCVVLGIVTQTASNCLGVRVKDIRIDKCAKSGNYTRPTLGGATVRWVELFETKMCVLPWPWLLNSKNSAEVWDAFQSKWMNAEFSSELLERRAMYRVVLDASTLSWVVLVVDTRKKWYFYRPYRH